MTRVLQWALHIAGPIAVAGASDGILYFTGMDKTCLHTSSWEFIRDYVVPDVHARRTLPHDLGKN